MVWTMTFLHDIYDGDHKTNDHDRRLNSCQKCTPMCSMIYVIIYTDSYIDLYFVWRKEHWIMIYLNVQRNIRFKVKPKRPGSPFYFVKIPISPMLKLQRSQSPTLLCGSPWNCDDILSYVYSPDKGPSFFEFHYRKENISNSNMQNCVFAYFIV